VGTVVGELVGIGVGLPSRKVGLNVGPFEGLIVGGFVGLGVGFPNR